jgi:excisionase family DNA binding protein
VSAAVVVLTPDQVDEIAARAAARALIKVDRQTLAASDERDRSPWLTGREVATRLGVSVKTVHRLSGPSTPESERLPCHRIGGNGEKRFHVDEVDAWLRSCNRVAV